MLVAMFSWFCWLDRLKLILVYGSGGTNRDPLFAGSQFKRLEDQLRRRSDVLSTLHQATFKH